MAASIPLMLKHSVVQNFLNSLPILINFVSKFIFSKVPYVKAQYSLRLRSSLKDSTEMRHIYKEHLPIFFQSAKHGVPLKGVLAYGVNPDQTIIVYTVSIKYRNFDST